MHKSVTKVKGFVIPFPEYTKKASEGFYQQRLLQDVTICESGGARTLDPRLKRPLLYQLSYRLSGQKQIPNIRFSEN